MGIEDGFNPFSAKVYQNQEDAPVKELKTISGETISEIVDNMESYWGLSQKKEGNILRLNLICPKSRLNEIVDCLRDELGADSEPLLFHIGSAEQFDPLQGQVLSSDTQINSLPSQRCLVLVTGIENAVSTGGEGMRVGNWRLAHDFFQYMADSNQFREWVAKLEDQKQVVIVLALPYSADPRENEAVSEAYRSMNISQFADFKLTFLLEDNVSLSEEKTTGD